MEAKLDIWIVLFIAAAAQGVFLTLMLFIKRTKRQKANVRQYLLGALMLTFTVTIAYYVTYWTGTNSQLSDLFQIIFRLTFIFGPLVYFYIYHVLNNRFPKHAWLHLLPFVLVNILFYSIHLISAQFTAYHLFNSMPSFHVLGYAIFSIWLVKKNGNNKWLSNIALSFTGYSLSLLTYYILVWTNVLQLEHDYIVSMGMTIFIYFIGYHGFKNPIVLTEKSNDEKYQKSSLTNQSLQHVIEKLDGLIHAEKLYTNGDLKLTDVANKLEISSHAISQAINVAKGKRFTDYLNELRVEEAISLMRKMEYQDEKLLAVAIDSGFNNKTSFLNAFKKHIGQSPSEYRKSIYSQAS